MPPRLTTASTTPSSGLDTPRSPGSFGVRALPIFSTWAAVTVACATFCLRSIPTPGCDIASVPLKGLARNDREQFLCADIETWQSTRTYDAIVLSEVLYYLRDVDGTLEKLARSLSPSGVMAASFFQHPGRSTPNRIATVHARKFLQALGSFQEFDIAAGKSWKVMYARRKGTL